MAQNSQGGTAGIASQNAGLQLQIPGMDQFKDLKFVQSEANPTDLVVQFPDGTEVVFPNYIPLAQAGSPPALTLEDGTVIPGQEIVSLIDNLNYDLIAPGAGDQGGDGVNTGSAAFSADPSGLLGDHIGHGPYAGGIEIADQVGFEQLPGYTGDDGGDGGGDLPFEAIDDHVIHNIQSGTVDIPDAALRHNDIYPRGDWDQTAADNPGPSSPPQSNFEAETVNNLTLGDGGLGSSTFYGSNTTARFTGETVIDGTAIIGIENNDGDSYTELNQDHETVQFDQVDRAEWDLGSFILQTGAPGGKTADWDGTRIYLYAGETLTMSAYSYNLAGDGDDDYVSVGDPVPGGGAEPNYFLGIDIDGSSATGSDPLFSYRPEGSRFGWDVLGESQDGSISYLVPEGGAGWYYLGIGNIAGNVTPEGMYRTLVEVDGVPYGEFDYSATDGVLSDSAHVIVDAIEESSPGGRSDLIGDSGDDIIISGDSGDDLHGNGGMDVLLGRGGDDHLYGGSGSDLFLFENALTDGDDTIFDFNAAEGDIINLDALFDALGVATREVLANESSGDTILTIGDGTGAALAAASGFSITLDGTTGLDMAQLTTDGNLVVDQS